MVKADAYGHGAVPVTKALVAEGVDSVGVALVEEGIKLREAGVNEPRVLVFGVFSQEAARACAERRLTPVLSRRGDLENFAGLDKEIAIHIKFNTGMNRMGFPVAEAESLARFLKSTPRLRLEGVCTHLISGDDWGADQGFSRRQMRSFESALRPLADLHPRLHVLNSSALIKGGTALGARPGIALYGAAPPEVKAAAALDLKPVMHFRAPVVCVHHLGPGDTVSYGARWTAEKKSSVAVVAAGYADGVSRALTNKGVALLRGQRVKMVGTICMDYLMLDVTALENERPVSAGETVTLWGAQNDAVLGANEVAAMRGTIAYEVFTNVGARVPRVYGSSVAS